MWIALKETNCICSFFAKKNCLKFENLLICSEKWKLNWFRAIIKIITTNHNNPSAYKRNLIHLESSKINITRYIFYIPRKKESVLTREIQWSKFAFTFSLASNQWTTNIYHKHTHTLTHPFMHSYSQCLFFYFFFSAWEEENWKKNLAFCERSWAHTHTLCESETVNRTLSRIAYRFTFASRTHLHIKL